MSKIEWTETTVNVITGCTKYSDGCKNCYAEKMHKRLTAMGQEKYKLPFNEISIHDYYKEFSKKITKNTKMCFVNSMSDTFHAKVPNYYIQNLLDYIKLYSVNMDTQFQILTKRAERLPDFDYPKNVWLGVTVEKAKYKNRIEYLKQTNAKIKFLSCEPLLDDLGELDLSGIDWVIAGGESGINARPMHPDWVRSIQLQCDEQDVPFFFKQWGEYFPRSQWEWAPDLILNDENAIIFEGELFNKVGKKHSGCLLDGKSYKEYPTIKD